VQRVITLFLCICLSACFQGEPETQGDNSPQSAIDVKKTSSTLSFTPLSEHSDTTKTNVSGVLALYAAKASDVLVEDQGKVVKLLSDDNQGSRHQRFLVKVAEGHTLLFAHNIDLADRIDDLKIGDVVSFKGEYVYNPKGGVVHWTHKDPKGIHEAGWIKHNGNTYQ
jgi:hypothetical protein